MEWLINNGVVGRRLDENFVLVNLDTQEMFELNSSGARIWELLSEGKSATEIVQSLAREYVGDPALVARDVRGLLDALHKNGMLRPARVEEPKPWMVSWTRAGATVRAGALPFPNADVVVEPSGDWIAVSGHVFDLDGRSRAEHVLALRKKHGDAFIDVLRGSFVVVSWERERNKLSVYRDPLGLAPFFYAWDGRAFHCASSVDALLDAGVSKEIHRLHLAEYVYGIVGSHQLSESFFEAIRRVPAGHRLSLEAGSLSIVRYWDPLPDGFEWASEGECDRLESLLVQAVDRCMAIGADAIALSGGFDSVSIALVAKRPLTALSMIMTNTKNDESATQRAVAEFLGMPQRWFSLPPREQWGDFIDRALALSSSSPLPVLSMWQWMLDAIIEEAGGVGCSKILMGTGGDEMFNVDPYYAKDLIEKRDLPGLIDFVSAWTRTSPIRRDRVVLEVLWRTGLRPKLVESAREHFGPLVSLLRKLRPTKGLAPPAHLFAELEARLEPEATSYVGALRALIQSPVFAMELDQSAAWEARGVSFLYPFYDRDLVELALRVPPEHFYAKGLMKAPLRALVANRMPQRPLPRRKVDFTRVGDDILRVSLPRIYEQLGGFEALIQRGMLERDRIEAWMRGYLDGRHCAPALLWRLLSAEAWLRARQTS